MLGPRTQSDSLGVRLSAPTGGHGAPTVYEAFAQLGLLDLPTSPRRKKGRYFYCTVLKIRLEELKEADTCPRSTSLLGWGENLVPLILNLVFPGFKVLQRLQRDQAHLRIKSCSE